MLLNSKLTKEGAGLFVPKTVSQIESVAGKRLRDAKSDPKLQLQAMLGVVTGVSPKKYEEGRWTRRHQVWAVAHQRQVVLRAPHAAALRCGTGGSDAKAIRRKITWH